ncbi:zinc-ribbon and DUF3426 domain-containing protein [Rhodoferax ferrireducens]|uniref:zinc-ribbon and DUF3426 domain-containing protein n=1 Tax=Rhodoferax ferrireducens TaxID=192843 RepID=UPI000E0D8BD7|nr:zinc-ribbon and DUF3426 domain-containing protein [Rhodoferax ferrireducens]
MSLITRCPACETLFKVVPDQLRISDGWVRCGQCEEIFDASLHLLQAASLDERPVVLQEDVAAKFEAADGADDPPQPLVIVLDSGLEASPDELPLEPEPEVLLPEVSDEEAEQASPEPIPDEFSQLGEVASTPPDVLDAQADDSHSAQLDTVLPGHVAQVDVDDPDDLDALEPTHSAEFSDVSFLRGQRNSSFWRKPLIRSALILLSFALLLGLSGQIMFHERDRIVASKPGLKPWMLTFCAALNCTLSPLRRIDSIVIDSSSFTKIRGGSYRLNFTMKNTTDTALAMPAIELTLTDSLDQPVVRRVFFPAEMGGNRNTLAAGSEWPASLAMAAKAPGAAERIAGYRLLAFYP